MAQLHTLPGGTPGGVRKGSGGTLCNYQEDRKCARSRREAEKGLLEVKAGFQEEAALEKKVEV